jgi:hypothetical protein
MRNYHFLTWIETLDLDVIPLAQVEDRDTTRQSECIW